jgi:hypothetical protein
MEMSAGRRLDVEHNMPSRTGMASSGMASSGMASAGPPRARAGTPSRPTG